MGLPPLGSTFETCPFGYNEIADDLLLQRDNLRALAAVVLSPKFGVVADFGQFSADFYVVGGRREAVRRPARIRPTARTSTTSFTRSPTNFRRVSLLPFQYVRAKSCRIVASGWVGSLVTARAISWLLISISGVAFAEPCLPHPIPLGGRPKNPLQRRPPAPCTAVSATTRT
jgi:hypothetical protein